MTGIISQSTTSAGRNRSYDIYLPSSYRCEAEASIILDFHGFTAAKEDQREVSDFLRIAEENNIIMIWPQGVNGTLCINDQDLSGNYWNAGFDNRVDDIAFINTVLDDIISRYSVNESRIYATGLSNGGFMSYWLACELTDRFAAIASVAGSMDINAINSCNTSRPFPVLQIHGTNDEIVPYEGGVCNDLNISSMDNLLEFWRVNANCSETITTEDFDDIDSGDNSTIQRISFTDCENGVSVEFLKVNGGGHSWPGSVALSRETNPVYFPLNMDINATQLIWEFFSRHTHPNK